MHSQRVKVARADVGDSVFVLLQGPRALLNGSAANCTLVLISEVSCWPPTYLRKTTGKNTWWGTTVTVTVATSDTAMPSLAR